MSERFARWEARLGEVRAAGRWRAVTPVTPTGPVTARVDGREVIVACSNDYLGLAFDLRVPATGGGAGASRLIGGSRPAHHALESALEEIFGRPALTFSSGWAANLAVLSTVCEPGDLIASDELNHASIIDGLRLSRAERRVVAHADPTAVPPDARLSVVEGLFSMDGDVPPLDRWPRTPWLCVDEAHAVGCLGPSGRGIAAMQGVEPDILVGTFGKAYGAAGAFVVGPPALKDLLINAGRSFIFTTAVPEVVAQIALAGLRAADDERRERLAWNVTYFRSALRQIGWAPLGDHHIVPIVVGPAVMDWSRRLLDRGIFVPGIRWPTVARGSERLRFTLSAAHERHHLDRILDALGPPPSA